MSRATAAFQYRMMNVKSAEMIDYAVRLGMNWVVAVSSGQKGGQAENDPPVYMPDYGRLQPIRQRLGSRIAAQRMRVRDTIARAKRAGLKVIYHSYEPSLPEGFRQSYPRLYSRPIREYYAKDLDLPEVKRSRELCVARPEAREALAAKVAEICRVFTGIDGFAYTNNESSSATKVWHRCDVCRDVPFAQMMMYLHEAMREGIRRSGRRVRLFYRCWGTHETDEQYWLAYKRRLDFGAAELPGKQWIAAYVECFAPEHLHFRPSRDIPAFLDLLAGDDAAVIYKATWADVNLHHPLNPWIGRYRGHDQICEISFEHCRDAPHVFYVVGKEMQRRVRRCAGLGVDGLCGVPVFFGVHDVRESALHPSRWSLAELNLHLFAALARDPEANLAAETAAYLKRRYGRPVPRELAAILLATEDVAAAALNVRGVQAAGDGLAQFYHQLLRYGPMVGGWQQLVTPTPENLKRIFAAKDRNVRRAARMLRRIDALRSRLPRRAYQEFRLCLGNLLALARRWAASHKHSLTLWAIKEGQLKPTVPVLERLCSWADEAATLRQTVSP